MYHTLTLSWVMVGLLWLTGRLYSYRGGGGVYGVECRWLYNGLMFWFNDQLILVLMLFLYTASLAHSRILTLFFSRKISFVGSRR